MARVGPAGETHAALALLIWVGETAQSEDAAHSLTPTASKCALSPTMDASFSSARATRSRSSRFLKPHRQFLLQRFFFALTLTRESTAGDGPVRGASSAPCAARDGSKSGGIHSLRGIATAYDVRGQCRRPPDALSIRPSPPRYRKHAQSSHDGDSALNSLRTPPSPPVGASAAPPASRC
jgi:hypothetical protein